MANKTNYTVVWHAFYDL